MSTQTPTPSLAVALHYDKKGAPRVVAKGRGELGERIVELAREHGVPIEENEVLAGALSQVELDDEIPPSFTGQSPRFWCLCSRLAADCVKPVRPRWSSPPPFERGWGHATHGDATPGGHHERHSRQA